MRRAKFGKPPAKNTASQLRSKAWNNNPAVARQPSVVKTSDKLHTRLVFRIRAFPRYVPLALIACAMLLRVIIPAGWMPTTGVDGMVRISVCTGMGAETAWIDHDGKIHKDAPAGSHHDPQPCGFGVLGLGLDETPALLLPLPAFAAAAVALVARQTLSVGHGLAAPPPPSTGPPSLI